MNWGYVSAKNLFFFGQLHPAVRSRSKSLPIFGRRDESLYHIGVLKVAVELIQLRQPEVIAGVVSVLWIIGIASQVSKVLH